MLTLDHLTKRFGEKTLFEDLCLSVTAPVVLWAPSGWGKTTLLRIVMGLEPPSGGRVRGAGRVAAVFQEDRLCPQLTAEQNIALVLPGAEAQHREALARDLAELGLDAAARALPARQLSGGQKRRAALLRALWAESDTLVLDEPFTGMDPAALERAAALLRARAAGKPTLLATHDREAIRLLGWPVAQLSQKLGEDAVLYDHPGRGESQRFAVENGIARPDAVLDKAHLPGREGLAEALPVLGQRKAPPQPEL